MVSTSVFPVTAEENVKVVLNGTELSFDVPPQIIDGRTLVPLRVVFEALGCDVYWSDALQAIIIVKNDIKLLMRVDYKDFYKFTGNNFELLVQQVFESNVEYVEEYKFDVPPKIIDKRTLVPIRFLCEVIGVDVTWDDINKIVYLSCDNNFILDENTDKSFAEQAFSFFQDLEDRNIEYEEYPTKTEYLLKYENTNIDILVELNIISKEDLKKDTFLTNIEALKILHKACAYNEIDLERGTYKLSEWYRGNTLEPLDYLDDFSKMLLLDLLTFGRRNQIITYNDVLNMNFDGNITNCEALKYVIRMLGDTYGCTDLAEEIGVTDIAQIYIVAYEKGIIVDMDLENADLPIRTKDFYEIIYKAIFTEMNVGGYAPTRGRYVDSIIAKNERALQPKEEVIINAHKITAEVTFNDDMSVSWTFPSEYKHFIEEDYWTSISTITDDGIVEDRTTSTASCNQMDATQIIHFIAGSYPEK